ncbi:MAG TPA: chemotaxis protein CheX [Clostridiales bacterium]|nr:chemotaxis protein CheX [Clostridiales bacterium]
MKVGVINPLFEAAQDVFKLMFDVDIEKGVMKIVSDMLGSNDANVVLGVTGDLKGSVIFGFPNDMALEMVRIMSGMEIDEIDGFVSSALGEVANIIGGNALTILAENNCICDIVPPQIFVGEYKTASVGDGKALVQTVKTGIGEFEISAFLKDR